MCAHSLSVSQKKKKKAFQSLFGCNFKTGDQDYHSIPQTLLSLLFYLLARYILFVVVDSPTNLKLTKSSIFT